MNRNDIFSNLLNRLLEKKLKSLEQKFDKDMEIINQINADVNAILEDKNLTELITEKVKISTVPIVKKHSSAIIKIEGKKILEKTIILKTEKSVRCVSKDKPKSTVRMRRSNTKGNVNANSDLGQKNNEIILFNKVIKRIENKQSLKYRLNISSKTDKLNKTVIHNTHQKNKYSSPEKPKEYTQKLCLKNHSNKLHTKNGSVLSTEDIKTPSSKKYVTNQTFHAVSDMNILQDNLSQKANEPITIQDKQTINIQETKEEKLIKIEEKNIQKNLEEPLKCQLNNISKFMSKNDLLKLNLNKKLSRIIIRILISDKKDEMILNEKNLKILREVNINNF